MDCRRVFTCLATLSSLYLATQAFIPGVEEEFEIDSLTVRKSDADPRRAKNLKFSAFSRTFDLPLEETENAFARDFRFFRTATPPEAENYALFEELEPEDKLPPGFFYSINDGGGSVYIEENDDGGLTVEGVIDDHVRILPTVQSRRHRAVRLSPWTRRSSAVFLPDFDTPPMKDVTEKTVEPQSIAHDIAYVEVLVVFDYKNTAALQFDKKAIYRYLGVFWNAVQKNFNSISNPEVRFVLTGTTLISDPRHEPFIRNHVVQDDMIDGGKTLEEFGKWLHRSKAHLPHHDIAILQTGMDIGLWSKHGFSDSLLGRAYVGTICREDAKNETAWNCGEGEDIVPMYTGILTITHEIAHLLSSPHDGDRTSKPCKPTDGYIMGYDSDDRPSNAYRFSSCSQKSIQQFLRNHSPCVWNKPLPKVKFINQLPGKGMTPESVCVGWFGEGAQPYGSVDEKVCIRLWCLLPGLKTKTHGSPPEGTVCGEGYSVCIKKKCRKRSAI